MRYQTGSESGGALRRSSIPRARDRVRRDQPLPIPKTSLRLNARSFRRSALHPRGESAHLEPRDVHGALGEDHTRHDAGQRFETTPASRARDAGSWDRAAAVPFGREFDLCFRLRVKHRARFPTVEVVDEDLVLDRRDDPQPAIGVLLDVVCVVISSSVSAGPTVPAATSTTNSSTRFAASSHT